jgi:nucleoside-diphosphate-sugar epimerase
MSHDRLLVVGAKSAIGSALISQFRSLRPDVEIIGHARSATSEGELDVSAQPDHWFYCDLEDLALVDRLGADLVTNDLLPNMIVFLPGLPLNRRANHPFAQAYSRNASTCKLIACFRKLFCHTRITSKASCDV